MASDGPDSATTARTHKKKASTSRVKARPTNCSTPGSYQGAGNRVPVRGRSGFTNDQEMAQHLQTYNTSKPTEELCSARHARTHARNIPRHARAHKGVKSIHLMGKPLSHSAAPTLVPLNLVQLLLESFHNHTLGLARRMLGRP